MSSVVSDLAEQLLKTYDYNLQNFYIFRNGISKIDTLDQFNSLRIKLIQALLDYENDYRQMANSLQSLYNYNEILQDNIKQNNSNRLLPQTQLKRNFEDVCAKNNEYIYEISRLKSTLLSKDGMIRDLQERLSKAEGQIDNLGKTFVMAKEHNDLINSKLSDLNVKTSRSGSTASGVLKKSIPTRVSDATLKIYASPDNTEYFQSKYGKDLHEKLITGTPNVKLLEQVENELNGKDMVLKTEGSRNPSPRKQMSSRNNPIRSYSNSERKTFSYIKKIIPNFNNFRLTSDRFDYSSRVYFNDREYWNSTRDFFSNYS
jgi:hypothetical protein